MSLIEKVVQTFMDPLVLFGFIAQFIFFLRFVVQWWESERKGESIIPPMFWYLSIFGTILILIYSIVRRDIVFSVASALNMLIYLRNIVLLKNPKKV